MAFAFARIFAALAGESFPAFTICVARALALAAFSMSPVRHWITP
jgi:hypothetical protein